MADRPDPPGPDRVDPSDPVILTYRRLLGHRFWVHTWLRLCVAVTIVAAAFVARHALGVAELDVHALWILAVVVAAYDVAIWPLARRYRDLDGTEADFARLLTANYVVVVLDFAALTCAVWLAGGARSPFATLYLLHVIVNAVVLSRRAAFGLLGLGYGLVVLLVVAEVSGLAPPPLPEGLVAGHGPLDGRYALTILVVHAILFGLTTFLLVGVMRALRRNERRIRLANSELRRLSDQRRDFLRIALHNLKAPVGAVTMFLENMRDGVAGEVVEQHRVWLDRSLQRLGDLTEFMKNMETFASVETDIISTEFTRVDLAKVVERLVEEYADVVVAKHHALSLDVDRPVPPVVGSERLLREAVLNFLTNAVKYTPERGRIQVRVSYDPPQVRIEVEDNGIGLAPDEQARLFREFTRISPHDPLLSKVEGSGLGLSIVQRIVVAHGGRTGVRSERGVGSTFWFEIPALME